MEQQQRRVLVAVPSTTDVVGAGGVAPRWAEVAVSLLMIGGIFGFVEASRVVNAL